MVDKLIDATKLGAPLPAWRWLIWYRPDLKVGFVKAPAYLVGGSDDWSEAKARAQGSHFSVQENPVWQTLN